MAQGFLARVNGITKQLFGLVVSAGAGDAGKIVALGDDGKLDDSVMPTGIGANTISASAVEECVAGKFVNLHYASGSLKMRLADSSNNRPAHGYVKTTVANAATGAVYRLNTVNSNLSALTAGSNYWLSTAGGVTATPLDPETDTGELCQYLGVASSTTEIITVEYEPVYL